LSTSLILINRWISRDGTLIEDAFLEISIHSRKSSQKSFKSILNFSSAEFYSIAKAREKLQKGASAVGGSANPENW
jgi:hypothetical protein